MAQIAAACQVSVGAFYGRFRDKMAFFDALRTLVMEETDASVARYLDEGRWAETPPRQIVEKTMRLLLTGCHNNRGVIRASLKHATTRPRNGCRIRRTARKSSTGSWRCWCRACPARRRKPSSACALRMQVVFGMIVNAVLNDPGPLTLADERLPVELTRMVASYLDL